jgi:hypothetical protein
MKPVLFPRLPLFSAIAALVGLAASGTSAHAGRIEQELLTQAPKILAYCEQQGYQNIGVLKFRARKGDGQLTDRLGTINSLLATRLELALILKTNEANPKVGIIHDASTVAAAIPGASHLTHEGRQKLFSGSYPLAWGNKKVNADAFIIGLAIVDQNLRKVDVKLGIFDNKTGEIKKIPNVEFIANVDVKDVIEAGETFVLRNAVPRQSRQMVKDILEDALETATGQAPEPGKRPEVAPVILEVYYGAAPHIIKSGQVDLPEPKEGEKICFVVKRTASKERLGIVLLVNGENTVFRQKGLPAESCRVWIMDPADHELRVEGYLMEKPGGGYYMEEFRVASIAESIANHVNYGKDTGTITLVVFRDTTEALAKADPPPPSPVAGTPPAPAPGGTLPTPPPATKDAPPSPPPATKDAPPAKGTPPAPAKTPTPPGTPGSAPPGDLPSDPPPSGDEVLLRRAVFPAKIPPTLGGLREQLKNPVPELTRGLIMPGAARDTHVDKHPFNRHPVPVMAQTIRYYVPK